MSVESVGQEKLIESSGYFDAEWYAKEYPDVNGSGMSPAEHFVRFGAFLRRSPGPMFDAKYYSEANPDVVRSGMNPLVHYLKYGRSEGRQPLPPLTTRNRPSGTSGAAVAEKSGAVANRQSVARPLNIAVCAHVYYASLWADISAALRNISGDWTLYITAPAGQEEEINRLVLPEFPSARIIPVPNAGYDVIPFIRALPLMREEGVELVCKLHTKKGGANLESLHPGAGSAWFHAFLDHLVGGGGCVDAILNEFRINKDLGMLGPAAFYRPSQRNMSINRVEVNRLLDFLGCSVQRNEDWGFFAGTMFWARLDIFSPLMSPTLLELFDSLEVMSGGRTGGDGSHAHALERIFGLLPRIRKMVTAVTHQVSTSPGGYPYIEIVADSKSHSQDDLKSALIQELRIERDRETIVQSSLFDHDFYLRQTGLNPSCDPVAHYLRSGAAAGLDPSPNFSTLRYLNANSDVVRAGLNPLVHYIAHGKNKGRSAFKGTAKECSDRGRRVFVSCWLKNKESIHDGLIELSERLRADGVRTTFITNAPPLLQDARIDVIRSDFLAKDYDVDAPNYKFDIPEWVAEVVAMESCWLNAAAVHPKFRVADCIRSTVTRAYAFWRQVFQADRPDIVLVWGSTAPISKLHLRLCQDLNIPTLVIERGHFPQTINVGLLGQFAQGAIALQPSTAASLSPVQDVKALQSYISWVRADQERAYPDRNRTIDLGSVLGVHRESGRKIVLFIGVNDLGSGTAYRSADTYERHSLMFHSSGDAFKKVREVLLTQHPDAVLVFKPHPADRADYSSLPADRLVVAQDWNINELIEYADVCVALSTTALARCLVERKPVVALGLSDLSMKGLTYECATVSDIPVMLRAALMREGFEPMSERGLAYVAHLFEHQLVGVAADAPTRLKIKDLAALISRRVDLYGSAEPTVAPGSDDYLRRHSHPARSVYYRPVYEDNNWDMDPRWRRPVDVVIPVYGDAEVTEQCIESVLASKGEADFRVVIICDKSPFPEVVAMLERYRGRRGVDLLHNERNLGFPGTANRGMAYSEESDVILLNSDTLVPKGWVDRLQEHAYRGYNVGTVTPFSNNASIFSVFDYPRGGELQGGLESVTEIDMRLQQGNRDSVEVPVGHGFCLYIKRALLRAVGYFDEMKFGKGYSEEVDLCLRARRRGFVHVCATNVLVGHVGGVSFAESGSARRLAARKIIAEEYPGYFDEVKAFAARDPLKKYRSCVSKGNASTPAAT